MIAEITGPYMAASHLSLPSHNDISCIFYERQEISLYVACNDNKDIQSFISANLELSSMHQANVAVLLYVFVLPDACMPCQDIQSHTDAPVPDFGERSESNTVRSVVPAAFHARPP